MEEVESSARSLPPTGHPTGQRAVRRGRGQGRGRGGSPPACPSASPPSQRQPSPSIVRLHHPGTPLDGPPAWRPAGGGSRSGASAIIRTLRWLAGTPHTHMHSLPTRAPVDRPAGRLSRMSFGSGTDQPRQGTRLPPLLRARLRPATATAALPPPVAAEDGGSSRRSTPRRGGKIWFAPPRVCTHLVVQYPDLPPTTPALRSAPTSSSSPSTPLAAHAHALESSPFISRTNLPFPTYTPCQGSTIRSAPPDHPFPLPFSSDLLTPRHPSQEPILKDPPAPNAA